MERARPATPAALTAGVASVTGPATAQSEHAAEECEAGTSIMIRSQGNKPPRCHGIHPGGRADRDQAEHDRSCRREAEQGELEGASWAPTSPARRVGLENQGSGIRSGTGRPLQSMMLMKPWPCSVASATYSQRL